MKIIGLTGSIGMGKSTTSKFIEEKGVPVFDADRCVHKLLGPGGKKVKIISRHFPTVVIKENGVKFIDRKKLGTLVFSDQNKRKILESIIHPEVNRQKLSWLSWAKRRRLKAVCLDVPLLFETGGDKYCNVVIVVSSPLFIQKQRVLRRKNMNKIKFKNILNNLLPEQNKMKKADYVVKTGIGYRFSRNRINKIIDKELYDK